MDLDTLYRQYGELLIQQEILQSKVQECKRNIVSEINKLKLSTSKE
ncbi:hypothetical protein LCGC14_0306390 [marine sediment metagenome]|uniref:Uncharacterized protein n=1 Tax=marine sediment metagenome TaxID=412755 RepID=A0A0F9TP32_9ZZZZ